MFYRMSRFSYLWLYFFLSNQTSICPKTLKFLNKKSLPNATVTPSPSKIFRHTLIQNIISRDLSVPYTKLTI